ncbi:MAG: hypothetical protein CM15mP13_1210 [Pseudomonadota bacterium]|nr:MAG: hypothetical protein CM15mP13_1210 [Pseudomonadota bacterium]
MSDVSFRGHKFLGNPTNRLNIGGNGLDDAGQQLRI